MGLPEALNEIYDNQEPLVIRNNMQGLQVIYKNEEGKIVILEVEE